MINASPAKETAHTGAAEAASRRGSMRLSAATRRCEACHAHHILVDESRIDAKDRLVLTKVATGLRAHEIAAAVGETQSQVTWRLRDLQLAFDALSRTHLVALAIFSGLVDLRAVALRDLLDHTSG